MLVGSPPCTAWSIIQNLNARTAEGRSKLESAKKRALVHLQFCAAMYREQMRGGRYFLHEHPDSASSWTDEQCIKNMHEIKGVATVVTDQYKFGQQSREGNLVKKSTRWMSNCPDILQAFDRRCTGRGGVCSKTHTHHQQCNGRTAKEAAIYPFANHLDNRLRHTSPDNSRSHAGLDLKKWSKTKRASHLF